MVAGGVAVGAHAERIRVLDLEEVRHLVEQPGDVGFCIGYKMSDPRLLRPFRSGANSTRPMRNHLPGGSRS